MPIRPHRTLAAAAAAAAVLALSGCGGGSDETMNASASSSTPSPSASPSASPSSPAATGAPGVSGSLADILARTMKDGKSAHVTIDLAGQGSGDGDIAFNGGATAARLTLTVAGQKAEVRIVDDTFYIAVPGQDGKFMKMDTDQLGSQLGLDSSHLGLDPSQALAQLERSGGSAEDLGEGHWQIVGKDGKAAADLYVGDDGLLQKVVIDSSVGGAITMTYSQWGESVSVKAPSDADIVKVPGV